MNHLVKIANNSSMADSNHVFEKKHEAQTRVQLRKQPVNRTIKEELDILESGGQSRNALSCIPESTLQLQIASLVGQMFEGTLGAMSMFPKYTESSCIGSRQAALLMRPFMEAVRSAAAFSGVRAVVVSGASVVSSDGRYLRAAASSHGRPDSTRLQNLLGERLLDTDAGQPHFCLLPRFSRKYCASLRKASESCLHQGYPVALGRRYALSLTPLGERVPRSVFGTKCSLTTSAVVSASRCRCEGGEDVLSFHQRRRCAALIHRDSFTTQHVSSSAAVAE